MLRLEDGRHVHESLAVAEYLKLSPSPAAPAPMRGRTLEERADAGELLGWRRR